MEGVDGKQESEAASVIKVTREPAIIINGVPDLPPDCSAGSQPEVKNDTESQVDPHFGEWLEGRKVRKLFGDTYYVGKVAKYDSESNWYNIIYDDGDQEDLEWCELEEVLLPLDITVPLRTLVIDKCKLQGSVPDYSRPKVGRPKKIYATMDDNTKKTSNMVTVSHGNDVMNNQMVIVGVEGLSQQSNNDATSVQLVTVTAGGNAQACSQASNQPRKRGRPRKDGSLSANSQPKKRGRPPKNSNASGTSQSAENTPDSLALVPVQDNAQESSRRQNSTFMRNAMTVRAEKLKRENLRVQGTPSGTR
ncbi:Dirigent protein 17 [Dichanthelium oligosanthes]|uniref:Dirigent protein 17 n=1 Tax=Dichanthelium oligosanthes TaxID=888268 RepID=A0A1E5VIP6_9POAL|nr:Dirigent protein 17 [Dichanthelium oligosanthes]